MNIMNKYLKRNNSGFTLIEIIVAMALLSLVVIAAISVMRFGGLYLSKSQEEYEFQFSTRMTLQSTSDVIRYSTAVFTIPESSFSIDANNDNIPDKLDAGWDYIGVHRVETSPGIFSNEIVQYSYQTTTSGGVHIPTVLIPAQENMSYEFVFTKVNPHDEDSLLQFTIRTYKAGIVDEYGDPDAGLVIISEVEARNSLQVIDLSAPPYDPAVAIAFRPHDRTATIVGHIAMVLDTSGSMANDLDGHSVAANSSDRRIAILQTQAASLINNFATEENIDIALVPFATSANHSGAIPFYSSKNQTSSLLTKIGSLNAIGGTNTGDGLRRAYWALKTHNAGVSPGVTPVNYVIILVDGVTTFASVIGKNNRTFVTLDGNVNEGYLDRGNENKDDGQIAGNGSSLDTAGTNYVNTIGTIKLNSNSFAKAYVIGFSTKTTELGSVNSIATACGAPAQRVFTAGSAGALQQVFDQIRQDIVNDLWYLQGPEL